MLRHSTSRMLFTVALNSNPPTVKASLSPNAMFKRLATPDSTETPELLPHLPAITLL